MEMSLEQQEPPDMSARQQANELIKLIRKLRWMGMEKEVEGMQIQLELCGLRPADSVLATPPDTD